MTQDFLSYDALPPKGNSRWIPQHKTRVVRAVLDGVMTYKEICEHYGLTEDELLSWFRAHTEEQEAAAAAPSKAPATATPEAGEDAPIASDQGPTPQ